MQTTVFLVGQAHLLSRKVQSHHTHASTHVQSDWGGEVLPQPGLQFSPLSPCLLKMVWIVNFKVTEMVEKAFFKLYGQLLQPETPCGLSL